MTLRYLVTLVVLVAAAQLPLSPASSPTAPAFLWSPHIDGLSSGVKEIVNYRTLSPRDLAKTWSNFLCSREDDQQSLDFALVFVGGELLSADISRPKSTDVELVNLLKVSFSNSNFSLAFPYVAVSEEKSAAANSLISEFAGTCQHNMMSGSVALLESCSVEGENFEKLADIRSVHDYIVSRMGKPLNRKRNLIMFCHGGSSSLKHSESQVLSELLTSVDQLGAKYTALYISDPFRPIQYPSHRELERFLADGKIGNGYVDATFCDGACKIKSSLLEGIIVAIVLLIILISGLCCMAGIDTPTRFETPQDS